MKRILFVAMTESVHTARWVNQLDGQGWDVHLFPVAPVGHEDIHPLLKDVTVHDVQGERPPRLDSSVRTADDFWPFLRNGWPLPRGSYRARWLAQRLVPEWKERAWRLAKVIQKLKPDLIHSLELQHASYLSYEARRRLSGAFPTWAVANWGSDIYLFGRLPKHAERIRALLAACDYYSCESQRDVELGRSFGFKGETFPIVPISGGFDLEGMRALRQPGPTSARRLILLKGYQNWAGRALAGLHALRLCADLLKGYRVAVFLTAPDVEFAAQLFELETGVPVDIVPRCTHADMLRLHGRSRVSIGLSISDAISTSFLEAFLMGSFPVQSDTSTANEWVRDGETGILVPPEDPQVIAAAIRRAVTDDSLVDRAAAQNATVGEERLDERTVRPQIVRMYGRILERADGKSVARGEPGRNVPGSSGA